MKLVTTPDEKFIAKGATLNVEKGPFQFPRAKPDLKRTKRNFNFTPTLVLPKIEDSEDLQSIISYLIRSGRQITAYKEKYVTRRVRVRMSRLGIASYSKYNSYLRSEASELKKLSASLSINVTRFFRNRDTFEFLKSSVFPELLKRKVNGKIKIWSAGCAVGAESYSLAMLAYKFFVSQRKDFTIYGTDVSQELLLIAEKGIYAANYLAELNETEATEFFTRRSDGYYCVKPHIKEKVKYSTQNLLSSQFLKGMDLIVCRNVLIYIGRDTQIKIFDKFATSLNLNGFLVLGRTESMINFPNPSLQVFSPIHRIFQKIENTEIKENNKYSINLNFPFSSKKRDPLLTTTVNSKIGVKGDKKQYSKYYTKRKPLSQFQKTEASQKETLQIANFSRQNLSKINKQTSKHPIQSSSRPVDFERPRHNMKKRLGELKNFRKKFEERRAIWEKKIEKLHKDSSLQNLSQQKSKLGSEKKTDERKLNADFRSLLSSSRRS